MEQATEGIFYCTANQHDPDAEREDILRLQENHRAWHRIWVRASKELMQDMHGRLQLLEVEGLE